MDSSYRLWIKAIARVGYCAKSVVYIVLGVLIVVGAFQVRASDNLSKTAVFQEILATPFGYVSLSAVLLGLCCYVFWRLTESLLNPLDLDMKKLSDILMRIFYLFSALAYTSIAYAAFKVLAGIASSSNDSAASNGSWLMQNQWGVYLFAAIGVIVLLFALIQFSHAIRRDFMDKFVNDMPSQTKQLIQHVGRLGFAARGVVYSLVGIFILHAAYTTDPDKAGGLDKAAQTVMQQPFGPWLLALLGLGLIGFGTFCGFEGRYRKTS